MGNKKEITLSERFFNWLQNIQNTWKIIIKKQFLWFIALALIFFVFIFWKFFFNNIQPNSGDIIVTNDIGTTIYNLTARIFRGKNQNDSTLLVNLIMSIGSIATAGSLILLWKDTEQRKDYEKEQLDIQKNIQMAVLIPQPCTPEIINNDKRVYRDVKFYKTPLKLEGDSRKTKGLDFYIADIRNNDALFVIKNQSKDGIAIDINIDICSDKKFKEGSYVTESLSNLASNDSFFIWKDPRYEHHHIHCEKDFFVRINYTSLFLKRKEKTQIWQALIHPFKLNFFDKQRYFVSTFSRVYD